MVSDEICLRDLLASYGADITHWPEEMKPFGMKALENLELAVLIEKEREFEKLLQIRALPQDELNGLEQRIIASSYIDARKSALASYIQDFFAEIKPAALAAMLVLGFAIGFGIVASTSQNHNTTMVQSVSDDEGAIL